MWLIISHIIKHPKAPPNARQKTAPASATRTTTHCQNESKSPPRPPSKRGGAYLGFLADVFYRLLLKKSVLFLPPF